MTTHGSGYLVVCDGDSVIGVARRKMGENVIENHVTYAYIYVRTGQDKTYRYLKKKIFANNQNKFSQATAHPVYSIKAYKNT